MGEGNTPRAFMLSGWTVWAWRCWTSWAPIDGGTRFVPALRSATVRGSIMGPMFVNQLASPSS